MNQSIAAIAGRAIDARSELTRPRFGHRTSYQIGVEEEHLLVSGDGASLVPDVEALIERVGETAAGRIEPDTFAECVELVSPPVADADAAMRALRALRQQTIAAGAVLLGAGVHPTWPWGRTETVERPRYRHLATELRWLLHRTPSCALHVHVGMPDGETAIQTCNSLRSDLPILMALSGNSPFLDGRDSGHASVRWGTWRAFPRTGPPPVFADYDDYARRVTCAMDAGGLDDFSYLWWDVRPNPRLGTVEVRVMDTQSRLETTLGLAALIHAVALSAASEAPSQRDDADEILSANMFHAARDGMTAVLWHGGQRRSARDVARATLARARNHARVAGFESALEPLERVIADGTGADRQRAAARTGGTAGLLRHLICETAAGA